jgi:hypothetical protein
MRRQEAHDVPSASRSHSLQVRDSIIPYAIPPTRSAAWKFDALRGNRRAQYRTLAEPAAS